MEASTFHLPSDCPSSSSFTSRSRRHPQTPPYTPRRPKVRPARPTAKRRYLERASLSPAASLASSTRSIHPAETSSPAKKAAKRRAAASVEGEDEGDGFRVQELEEGDPGYASEWEGVEVVWPEETESVGSSQDGECGGEGGGGEEGGEGDDELSSSEEDDGDGGDGEGMGDMSGISRRLGRLRCEEDEVLFEERRRLRRMSKRMGGSSVFKRSHSQSLTQDDGFTSMDADALDDQDVPASQRRLRRRVRGPEADGGKVFEERPARDSLDLARTGGMEGTSESLYMSPEREVNGSHAKQMESDRADEDMEVDES